MCSILMKTQPITVGIFSLKTRSEIKIHSSQKPTGVLSLLCPIHLLFVLFYPRRKFHILLLIRMYLTLEAYILHTNFNKRHPSHARIQKLFPGESEG